MNSHLYICKMRGEIKDLKRKLEVYNGNKISTKKVINELEAILND